MRKTTILRNIFFLALIFLCFIATLETLLRTTHLFGARISWAKPDHILGWRNYPHYKYWQDKENDHPITGRFNSYGWRDKEWSLQKPKGTYRIAVLGDSYVEAFQVEAERTFLSLTEKALNNNHGLKVELMNFGQSGFTQTEEYIVLQNDIINLSPDMVILFFLPGNDIEDISFKTNADPSRPFYIMDKDRKLALDTSFSQRTPFKVKSLISPIKNHSAIVSLLTERYNLYTRYRETKSVGTNSTNRIYQYLSLATSKPDATYSSNYQLNKILIKKMADFCKGKDISFMLVTIDIDAYKPERERYYKNIDPTFDANFFENDLMQFSKSINIEYIGLQRIFRKYYETTGTPLHWGHWNYEGHEVVANALTDKLRSIIYSEKN